MTERYTVQEFVLTYGSWQSLMQRMVYKSSRKDHALYRGRGIKLCERWRKFENFLADMGPRTQKELTLDRIDNNGNYEPGNCRWATAKEQAANTRSAARLVFKGESLPIAEWARRTGLKRTTIQVRLKAGWSLERIFTTAPNAVNAAHISFVNGRDHGKKLSASDVEELVRYARSGQWTAVELGRRYGVSSSAICYVAKQFGVRFKKGRPKK